MVIEEDVKTDANDGGGGGGGIGDPCIGDGDCQSGLVCTNGTCQQPACNPPCGTGESCVNGTCVPDGSTIRIIAVLAGQDFFGIGTQDLWDSLGNEAWVDNTANIVRWFRCDADWDPFDNAEWWIQDLKEIYPGARVIITGHSNGGDGARKVAAKLAHHSINVDLLFLFDMVPKPWEFGEPDPRTKPVSNAAVAIENYQRDDTLPARIIGIWPFQVYFLGWRITGGSNIQFTTHYLPHGPGPVSYVDRDTKQTITRTRYPHTEMVYNSDLKVVLKNRINSLNP